MEFTNEFDVDAPIDRVWETLLDLEKVAPAMPGAQVLEKVDDDNYKVAIKVKVGPMSMQYRGDVQIVDKDEQQHRATLKVKAREARGQGNATAEVIMHAEERNGRTHVTQQANVQLAGRVAAMGGGMIQEVSSKLVQQFAKNLSQMLAGAPAEAEQPQPAPAAQPAASGNGGAAAAGAEQPSPAAAGAGGATATATAEPKSPPQQQEPWSAQSSDDAGVDALGIAASVAADRLRDPRILLGTFGFVLLIGWLLGRASRG
jgi:uncharacterized protein